MFQLSSDAERAGAVALATVQNAPDPIVWWDRDGHLREANHAAIKGLGYKPEEMANLTVFDINPRSSEKDWEKLWQAIADAGTLRFETYGKHKEGFIIPVEIVASYLKYADEDYVCFFIRDLREQRKAQQEITDRLKFESFISDLSKAFIDVAADKIAQEIDDWLESLVDLFDVDRVSIFELSSDQTIFNVSHSLARQDFPPIPKDIPEEAFPWSTKQIKSGKAIIYGSPNQLPEEAAIDKALFEEHGPRANLTVPMRTVDKIIGGLSISLINEERQWSEELITRAGLIGEIFSNAINRRRNEEELMESKLRYQTIFESSPFGIFVVQQGVPVAVNPTMTQMLGYSAKELLEMDFEEFTHPEDSEEDQKFLQLLNEGKITEFEREKRYITKSNEIKWGHTTVKRVLDNDGNLLYSLVVVEDITERKSADLALQESEKNFRDAVDALGDATHVVDRDFKILIFNQSFVKWSRELGLESDAVGKYLIDVFPFLGKNVLNEYIQVFKTGKMLTTEEEMGLGGKTIFTKTRKIPIFEGDTVSRVMTIIRDFTQQKLAETALRESEANYRLLVENQTDLVMKFDPDGNILFTTPSFCNLFGGAPTDWIGKPLLPLVHDDDVDKTMQAVAELLAPPYKCYLEIQVRTISGWRWIAWANQSVLDDDGNVVEIIAVGRDITSKRHAEDYLRHSETRLRSLVENIFDIIWVLDTETVIKFESPSVAKALDYKPNEIHGRRGIEFVHPDDQQTVLDTFEKLLLKENPFELSNFRFRHADGHYVHLEAVMVSMIDDPAIEGIIVTARDITSRIKAEEELRESEEKFRSFINSATDSFVLFNSELNIIQMNNRHMDMFHPGMDKEDLIGKNLLEIVPYIKETERFDDFIRVIETGISFFSEDIAPQQIFGNRSLSVKAFKMADGLGTITRDITERKRAETDLQRRVEEVWTLNNLAQRVSASLSREDVIDAAIESIDLPIDMDFSLIFLCEGDKIVLQKSGPNNTKVRHKQTPEHAVGECLCGLAVKHGKPIFSEDINNDPHCTWKECKEAGVTSFAALPLKSGAKVIGVLGIASIQKTDFSLHDGFLQALAAEIAIGLQNALLYEQVEQHGIDLEKSLRERNQALGELEKLKNQLQKENIYLRKEIGVGESFENIISRSDAFNAVLRRAGQVANTEATVLLLGETGTGKGLIADAIHSLSSRKERPMVKINCAALPANLIESELFGHEKGSFTGAIQRKVGRFELADDSTIFLDEIGDLPPELQSKLLRVLQEGEFERVGSSETLKTNARVVAATNRNLEKAINEGKFREDLFYRLSVFPIEIPPLRDRVEDIPILTEHFVKKYSLKVGKTIDRIPRKTIQDLLQYHWPGNVRELENVIERAVILTEGTTLHVEELQQKVPSGSSGSGNNLKEIERDHILKVLNESNWIIEGARGAAEKLGLAPSTLRDRMKRLKIRKLG
ncbi:PAS domain S-box protein [bacterium]|nr:PAS domain S-box protein [bacterium]